MRIFETTVERERNIFPSKEKNDSEDGTYFLLVKIDADGSTSILNIESALSLSQQDQTS